MKSSICLYNNFKSVYLQWAHSTLAENAYKVIYIGSELTQIRPWTPLPLDVYLLKVYDEHDRNRTNTLLLFQLWL